MPDDGSFIGYARIEAAAVIRFDRPDKLNACTRAMTVALVAAIERADADEAVRCLILTGTGRAFCAGADLTDGAALLGGRVPADEPFRDSGGVVALRLHDCRKPVIVAFNGPAAGMGVTLALAADIRIASRTARFALPFVRRGIVPESCSSWFLPRIVGLPRALDWMLRGATVSVEEALEAGLVRSVHEPDALMDAALALAREIAIETAPVSVALTRRLLWRMAGEPSPHRAHAIESRLLENRAGSADVAEGVASFLEKRRPRFPDRLDRTSLTDDW